MIGHLNKNLSLFNPPFSEILDTQHPLFQLAQKIDWAFIEKELTPFYSKRGRPAHPIRLMAGLLILKSLRNVSDEMLVDEQWRENIYYQYFCGMQYLQTKKPCASSDLVYFRRRIGEAGGKVLLHASIKIHDTHDTEETNSKNKEKEEVVYADTTVQEKNITFPTDAKLQKKIIDTCNKIAKKEGVKLKNNFKKKSQKLLQAQHKRNHPKRREEALLSAKELKRIAGVILRDVKRKLSQEKVKHYEKEFALFEKKLLENQKSKEKIYSFHEPEVHCLSKGKANKKYEFGSKFGIVWSQERGIIVSGYDCGNQYDGHSLNQLIRLYKELNDKELTDIYCDRGYRGAKVEGVKVHTPDPPRKKEHISKKRKKRKHFRNRAGIEPIISHLKHDFRMGLNYLRGKIGDILNGLFACAAFNFKKWMQSVSLCLFLKKNWNTFLIFFLPLFLLK